MRALALLSSRRLHRALRGDGPALVATGENCPHDPCELVGHGNHDDVLGCSGVERIEPRSDRRPVTLDAQHGRAGTSNGCHCTCCSLALHNIPFPYKNAEYCTKEVINTLSGDAPRQSPPESFQIWTVLRPQQIALSYIQEPTQRRIVFPASASTLGTQDCKVLLETLWS